MKKNISYRPVLCLVICLLGVWTAGCHRDVSGPENVENIELSGYSTQESLVILANEVSRFEKTYTDQIWSVKLGDQELTFQDVLKDQVLIFLKQMKVMNLMAQDRGVELTPEEEKLVSQASEAYFEGLDQEEKDYLAVSQEDVTQLYRDYRISNQLIERLTKEMDLEVSDSEARVIEVQEVITSDSEKIKEAQNRAEAGEEFARLVKEYSDLPADNRKVGKGEESETWENEVLSLETAEISQVFEQDGKYYLVFCVNSYDEESTRARKEELVVSRKNQAFRQIYDDFLQEHPVEMDRSLWDGITWPDLTGEGSGRFFTVYQEYFS